MGEPKIKKRFSKILPLIAILGLFITLCGWGLASPVGSSPDENFHLASTWCAWGESQGICQQTGKPDSRLIPWELVQASCYSFEPDISASCQTLIPLGTSNGMAISDHGNFQHNYPPVFYSVMRILVSQNIDLSVVSMRILNSLIFCLILMAAWYLVPKQKRTILFWMWAGTAVPLTFFLVPSVNPSSWAITAVGTSWLFLDAFFNQSGKKRIFSGLVFLALVLMAAGSRGDAAIYVCLTSVVVVVLNFKELRKRKKLLLLPIFSSIIAVTMFFGSAQSTVASTGLYSGGEVPIWNASEKLNLLLGNLIQLPALWAGVFGMSSIGSPAVSIGNLGWLDTQMPMMVWLPALAVFISLGFNGLSKLAVNKTIAILILGSALIAIPLYVLQKSYASVGAQVQPRYLLPLVIVLLGVLLTAPDQRFVRVFHNKTQLIIVLFSLFIANGIAIHFLIRRFVTGNDVRGINLNSGIEWWWSSALIQPMFLWIITSLAFGVTLIAGAVSVKDQHSARMLTQQSI